MSDERTFIWVGGAAELIMNGTECNHDLSNYLNLIMIFTFWDTIKTNNDCHLY